MVRRTRPQVRNCAPGDLEILRCAIAHHSSRLCAPRNDRLKGLHTMPVILDPDAAAVFKAFQEAGRPAYETPPAAEARELYLKGRFVTNPEPPALHSVQP